MNHLVIKKGSRISRRLADKIFSIWKKEFDNPEEKKEKFADDIFFILRNSKKEIVSVGRLKPVKLKFMKNDYHVLGIADVVSVVRKKGYGKRLMKEIKKYLKQKKKTGIGFCFRKNSGFYRKCGFGIARNQVARFVYKNKKKKTYGDIDINKADVDVIYFNGKDFFADKFLKNKKQDVKIYIPHW